LRRSKRAEHEQRVQLEERQQRLCVVCGRTAAAKLGCAPAAGRLFALGLNWREMLFCHDKWLQASDFIQSCGAEKQQVSKASLMTFITEQNVYTQVRC
jgi:hypothetical protein